MITFFYQKNNKNIKNKGFVLFYSLLIVGVILIATSMFLESALEEIYISGDRKESDVALYMAESGINCAKYHQNHMSYSAFKTARTEPDIFRCDEDVVFEAGWNTNSNQLSYPPLGLDSDNCFYKEDEDLIFGLGLNPDDYGAGENLVDNKEAIVIRSTNPNSTACARVTVEIRSYFESFLDVTSYGACNIMIRSVGASDCDADGFPTKDAVERTLIYQTE